MDEEPLLEQRWPGPNNSSATSRSPLFQILDYLWGADDIAESNIVDRHIRNLRMKLQNHSKRPRYIATVPGHGYRFMTAPEAPTAPPSTP
jgi:DNA-binding winged helix-turn-helix (wHTH) protein